MSNAKRILYAIYPMIASVLALTAIVLSFMHWGAIVFGWLLGIVVGGFFLFCVVCGIWLWIETRLDTYDENYKPKPPKDKWENL